jgi:signal transduction histidine kinase
LIVQIGLMIVGLVVLSAAAVIGINGLHQDLGTAVQGYHQLRQLYEIGMNVAVARTAIQADGDDAPAARMAIQGAMVKLETGDVTDAVLQGSLREAAQKPNAASIDSALARLAEMSAGIRTSMQARQIAADQKRQVTLVVIIAIAGAVVLGGIAIGVRQYRGVMRPLRRLSAAARQMAQGNFPADLDPASRDREFTQLADDFNHMATELATLYRELEDQVAAKSKQLVRSERLASVGYLAAGVAHEINNPLGIITGYGERAMQQLDRDPDSALAGQRARQAIAVMCEEAFRCKQITDRLLSLARPGNENRSAVSLVCLTDEVIGGVSGLPEYRDRKIVIETDARDDLQILARDGEMKQVILNLLINALEAVDAGTGLVRVTIKQRQDEIELGVCDNGRGMDGPTLDRVFEPFFTHKRGSSDRRGTGLGLSITHAIIAEHGGSIVAESDGPGRGSRFVVRLPALAATEGEKYVNR